MKTFTARAIACLCFVATAAQAKMGPCSFNSGKGANFDLNPLKNGGQYNQVTGEDFPGTTTVEKGYKYYFSICENVANRPQVCKTEGEPLSPVYQIDPTVGKETCHTLSRNLLTEGTGQWSLLDVNDPSAGVVLQYSESSKRCNHGRQGQVVPEGQGAPRVTRINFKCTRDKALVTSPYVFERNKDGFPSHCDYDFTVKSMWACPTECKVSNSELCAGHGICGYDHTNNKAKCFCDDDWMGDDCNTSGSAHLGSNPGTTAALVILILLVVGLFAGVWFLAKQVKAYRNDASNYMQIRNQEMGSMSVDQI